MISKKIENEAVAKMAERRETKGEVVWKDDSLLMTDDVYIRNPKADISFQRQITLSIGFNV